MAKRSRRKKNLLDKIFDLVDYFFPLEKKKEYSNFKQKPVCSKKENHNKQEIQTPVQNTTKEMDLQQLYNTKYLYEGRIQTGKEIITYADRINYTESGQLAFIQSLQKSGYLKNPSEKDLNSIKQAKETVSVEQPKKLTRFSPKLQQYYVTQYKHQGIQKSGKEIIRLNGMLDRTHNEQINFLENLILENKITIENTTLFSDFEKKRLAQLSVTDKVDLIYKEEFLYYGERTSGYNLLKNAARLDNKTETQLAFIAALLRTGKLKALNNNMIEAIFPNEMITPAKPKPQQSPVQNKKIVSKPIKKKLRSKQLEALHGQMIYFNGSKMSGYDVLKTVSKLNHHESTQIAYLESIIHAENSHKVKTTSYGGPKRPRLYNEVKKSKAPIQIPANQMKPIAVQDERTTKPELEESVGEMLGQGIGFGAGIVVGGPIAIIGELLGNDMLRETGEQVINVYTQQSGLLGGAVNGGVNMVVGKISDDEQALETGKVQLASAGKKFVKSVGQTIENVVDSTMDVIEGFRNVDGEQVFRGGKNLVQKAGVSALTFGVIGEAIDASVSSTDSSVASNHGTMVDSYFRAEGGSDQSAAVAETGQHYVKPHEVAAHYRGDAYIDSYVRDGDGDTSVNRTVEEGGGYMRSNPSS